MSVVFCYSGLAISNVLLSVGRLYRKTSEACEKLRVSSSYVYRLSACIWVKDGQRRPNISTNVCA